LPRKKVTAPIPNASRGLRILLKFPEFSIVSGFFVNTVNLILQNSIEWFSSLSARKPDTLPLAFPQIVTFTSHLYRNDLSYIKHPFLSAVFYLFSFLVIIFPK